MSRRPPTAKPARRWWRWPLYLFFAVLTLLALLLVALRTSFAREQVRVRANAALAGALQGKIVIERLGGLSLWGASGVDARIFDPAGHQVILVRGLSCVASVPGLLRQLLFNSERPQLELWRTRVDYADVTLREDEANGVTLATTFLPRPTATAPAPAASDAGVRIHLSSIELSRVWAHGRVAGSPPLDADLLRVQGSLRQTPRDGLELELEQLQLVTRALPLSLDPSGRVSGRLAVPAEAQGPLRLEGSLEGTAAGSPLALEISWVGDQLHAAVQVLRLPASVINAQLPDLALQGDVTLGADVDGLLPELDYQVQLDSSAAHAEADGYAIVAEGMELGARVALDRLNLAGLSAGAPASHLQAAAQAFLFEQDDGYFLGAGRVDLQPGTVAGQRTPSLWLTAQTVLDAEKGVEAHGRVAASEAGAAVEGGYELKLPRQKPAFVAAALRARLNEPERLRALGLSLAGSASVTGELRPDSGAVAAKISSSLSHLDSGVLQSRNVELRAGLSGSLSAPRVEAAATLDAFSGRAHADLKYAPDAEQLDLFVTEIDLLRVSHVLGLPLPLEHGTFELDAHVARRGSEDRYTVDGRGRADLGRLGSVDIAAERLRLPKLLRRPADLAAAEGKLTAQGRADLEAWSPLLLRAGLPIERTTGKVRFELGAQRGTTVANGFELSAQVDSNGLRVVEQRETPRAITTTAEAKLTNPRALEGIDLHATAHAWPERDDLVATVILRDHGGTLLEAQAETGFGDALGRARSPQLLASLPFKVLLNMPERRLQSLPALVRPAALWGRVQLQASVDGPLQEPRAELALGARSLRAAGSKEPVDVDANLAYASDGGRLQALARLTRGQTQVASASLDWRGDLQASLRSSTSSGLLASVAADLSGMPLDVFPALVDRQLAGHMSGSLELKDWGRDAHLKAQLRSGDLVVGKVPIRELAVQALAEGEQLQAEVALRVAEGSSRAKLDAGMHWGERPFPELQHRGVAELETHAFRLESLSPLFSAYVSEIAGVLDASTRVTVTPTETRVAGSAKLEHGVVQLPAIGQRFSEISARLAVADDRFKLERLDARGTTGRVSVNGSARLDGFALREAAAHVTIPKHESIPITLEGAVLGDAWGNVDARFESPERGERQLVVDVPELHLMAPENSGHGLQSLDEPEDIRVGVRRADGKFVALPVQPLDPGADEPSSGGTPPQPLRITVALGPNVSVERGRSAQAQLTGKLSILSGTVTEVDGRIEVRGGKLDVSGKTFEIERGVVTFAGDDPSNPSIAATARWDAPGYTVYADYVGDVKNGRIKLHAEPPLTQDEIASLLLFGSPEGSLGASDSSSAALAVSVAGDQAVRGLNQVLDEFTNLDVSARVDTTTGSARPELVFQVSPRVAAKVTRAIGAPAAGESPDRTFLTLELRLRRAWALSALLGDKGASALDLIWRRRY